MEKTSMVEEMKPAAKEELPNGYKYLSSDFCFGPTWFQLYPQPNSSP